MTMSTIRFRSAAAHVRRLIPVALLAPWLALAQVPAATDATPTPPVEPKDAPKDVAPPAADVKDAGKDTPKDAAKDASKAPANDPAAKSAKAPGIEDLPPTGPLAPLAWLSGCWAGDVNKRQFREYWHPLRGNLMVGASRNALPERTISYEYLRLEPRADGVYYITTAMGKVDTTFKLASTTKDAADEVYTFRNVATVDFPKTLSYRRGGGGWLYVEVAGIAQAKDHKVTYPFRRVSCETGEFIRK